MSQASQDSILPGRRDIGKRLAVTATLLLVPTAILVFLYVGMLNREVEESNRALAGLEWAARLNELRLDVLKDDTEIQDRYRDIEETMSGISGDLVSQGLLPSNRSDSLLGSQRYRKENSDPIDIQWRSRILKSIAVASDHLRNDLGYSMVRVLEHDEVSELLFTGIPSLAQEMYEVNYWVIECLLEEDSEKARELIARRSGELIRLGAGADKLNKQVRDVSNIPPRKSEIREIRSRIRDRFEVYERSSNKFLDKKRKLSLLDILGQVESNGVREAESSELWSLGKTISIELLEYTRFLEEAFRDQVVAHRDSILVNRNWTLALVGFVAALALLLGYYIAKNMSLVHAALREQNVELESKIRERVSEIEQARGEAIRAATIAERERNYAIELNDDLQKETARANELARKAVAAEQAKSQFLANMSHEIRTPMNGVIGMTHLLRESNLSKAQTGHIETLEQCSESLLVLIDEVLDLSKIESGKLEIDQVESDLVEVISSITNLFAPTAHKKRLKFQSVYPADFDKKLYCDPYRMRQVLSNLLSNAIKFTNEGAVRLDMSVLEMNDEEALFRFSVSDTGIGISKAHQDDLFQAFAQADSSTTRKFGGTGLGLAISKKLVELMGGDLLVSSENGVGSEFYFELAFKVSSMSMEGRSIEANKHRSLVVSESKDTNQFIEEIFDRIEVPCDCLSEWSENVDTKDYSIVLLDSRNLKLASSRLERLEGGPKIVALEGGQGAGVDLESEFCRNLDVFGRPFDPLSLIGWLRSASVSHSELAEEPGSIKSTYSDCSVLLVDDNEINLLVAEGLIERYGIKPIKASSGEAAYELCQTEKFDLVFMDWMMPGMDGYQTTRELRNESDGLNANTPIVALTANAMRGDREKCLKAGMDDYLSKPLRPKELESALEKWLRTERVSDGSARVDGTPNADDRELLNLAEFNRMFDENDEAVVSSLLSLFVESLNENLSALEDVISDELDLEKTRSISHSIKGSSANYGELRLNRVADELEKVCLEGNSSKAIELVEEMRKLCNLTQKAVKDIIV